MHGFARIIVAAVVVALGSVSALAQAPSAGDTFRDCPECPEMVVVPAGSFMMGSPESEEGRWDYEGPRHQVTVPRPFAIGKYEVTFAEWDACDAAHACGPRPGDTGWGRGNRPVINISWNNVQDYVRWLGTRTGHEYRLPSEAEWEYAARGGTQTRYWWGDEVGRNKANCDGCGGRWDAQQTAPVGSFAANPFGLHDVHGNVWEWIEDCWHDSYGRAPVDGSAWTNGTCNKRVLRGGSFSGTPRFVRSANRSRSGPGFRNRNYGFRVVRTLD